MNVRTKTRLAWSVGTVLFIGILGLVFYASIAKEEKGIVVKASNLPEIGNLVEGMPVEGELEYYYRKQFGVKAVFFRGKTNDKLIRNYFEENLWDSFHTDRDHNNNFSEKYCYPITSSKENEVFMNQPEKKSGYIQVMIYYMPSEERFTGKAYIRE